VFPEPATVSDRSFPLHKSYTKFEHYLVLIKKLKSVTFITHLPYHFKAADV